MTLASALALIFVAGLIGGVINALLSDNGFVLPRPEDSAGIKIYRPGFLGNMIIGGIAACISWGLYGPFAGGFVAGGPPPDVNSAPVGVALSALMGAVLVGIGGARWLTNEVDKKLLRAAGTEAAQANPTPNLARAFAAASPANALKMAAAAPL